MVISEQNNIAKFTKATSEFTYDYMIHSYPLGDSTGPVISTRQCET